jgi:hypothetical protein
MGSPADQERDEAICGTIETVGDSMTYVSLYVQQEINGSWSSVWYPIDSLKKQSNASTNRNEIRMTSGYFDGRPAKEFAVAYNLPDSAQLITIRLFRLDSTTHRPIQITSMKGDTFPRNLGSQAFFDIAAGDYDGDGLDEIMLVNNADLAHTSALPPYYALLLHFHVYDFDVSNMELVSKGISLYQWAFSSDSPYTSLAQLTMISGDFNGNGRDESACAWAFVDVHAGYEWDYLQMISVSPDLMDFSFEYGVYGSQVINGLPHGDEGWFTSATVSLAVGDLNTDGNDELVYAGLDSIYVFEFNSTLFPTKVASFSCNTRVGDPSHRTVAIEDVDGDTTFADSASANWYPEIITFEWLNNPTTQSTSGSDNVYIHKLYKLTDASNFAFISKVCNNLSVGIAASPGIGEGGIIPAYFAGNKITMGIPKLQAVKNLIEPVIIINAPPIHFDVINDSCYDICKSYPIGGTSAFSSQLLQTNSTEADLTTETHSSWGLSSTLSAGGKFLGIGVKASLTAKYGEDFKNTQSNDSTFTVTYSKTAQWDDLIYATVTDYDIWEYPVYADGAMKGHVMAAIAHPLGYAWFYNNDEIGYGDNIILDHEPGNLLSYPDYSEPMENPDLSSLIYEGGLTTISPSSSPGFLKVDWSTIQSSGAEDSTNYGFSAKASVEGWGVSVETEGDYNQGSVNTHTTTISQSFELTANAGAVNPLYANAGYAVTPYAYWSQEGALVLDYMVSLDTNGIASFWEGNYSSEPDLTFNCYYRYFAQKGLGGLSPEMADWTKEIQIFPATPKAGDTVTVLAEIRNYSLKATSGPVQVRFYLGSSDSGGIAVSDLNGDTVFTTSSPVGERSDHVVSFKWKIPTGLTSSDSILYGVIDPYNKIDELKKDNNKAWNSITILGTTPSAVHNPTTVIKSFELSQNYPNPFNPTTLIQYRLPAVSHVTLKVYDVLGREVATLVNGRQTPGTYKVEFNGSRFASGVYFYRLQAGSYTKTMKLLLLK